MTPALGAVLGAVFGLLLLMLFSAAQPRPDVPADKARGGLVDRWKHLTRRPAGAAGRRRDLLTAVALLGGIAAYALSGWAAMLLVVPLATFGIPWLWHDPNKAKIARLAAIEAWTRQVRSLLVGGADTTLEAALIASLASAPDPIQPEVKRLVARLNSRMATDSALVRFADDLDDSVGDSVAAAMMLASYRRGGGLVEVMDGLAEGVRDEVEARRKQESAKAATRTSVRYMTLLVVIGIPLLMVLSPSFVGPYRSTLGQLLFISLTGAYIGGLVMLRKLSIIKDKPRIYPRRKPTPGGLA